MRAAVIILLLCLTGATLWAGTPAVQDIDTGGDDAFWFVGRVLSIHEDPLEGSWIVVYVASHRVLVWLKDVHEIRTGEKVLIMGTYAGTLVYPTAGEIPVYIGWYVEVL